MSSLLYFFLIYFQTIGIIGFFGCVGYFLIHPFCNKENLIFFAAPAAGVMLTGLGCAILYGYAGLPFKTAFLITSIIGIFLSLTDFFSKQHTLPWQWKKMGIMLSLFIGILVYLCNYHSIKLKEPVLLLMAGSDHLGYANVADWILFHTTSEMPKLTATDLSQLWPYLSFSNDMRFGVYYFYASILAMKAVAAPYLYNFVLGASFSIALLGIVGSYTKKYASAFLLALAVLISSLFEAGLAGYLGKVVAYSSTLIVAGIFLNTQEFSLKKTSLMFFLTLGLCTLYPAQALSFILFGTLFLASLLQAYYTRDLTRLRFAFLIALLPLIFSGIFSLPQHDFFQEVVKPFPYWERLLPASYNFISADLMRSIFPFFLTQGSAKIIIIVNTLLAILFIFKKNNLSAAYLLFPLIWLSYAFGNPSQATYFMSYELVSLPFLLSIIALIHARDHATHHNGFNILILILIIFECLMCFGRFNKERSYFTSRASDRQILIPSQIQALTQQIKNQSVIVDTHDPLSTFLMLIYAKPQDNSPHIYWTARAWKNLIAPAKIKLEPQPMPLKAPAWHIQVREDFSPSPGCQLTYHTNQYFLYHC